MFIDLRILILIIVSLIFMNLYIYVASFIHTDCSIIYTCKLWRDVYSTSLVLHITRSTYKQIDKPKHNKQKLMFYIKIHFVKLWLLVQGIYCTCVNWVPLSYIIFMHCRLVLSKTQGTQICIYFSGYIHIFHEVVCDALTMSYVQKHKCWHLFSMHINLSHMRPAIMLRTIVFWFFTLLPVTVILMYFKSTIIL